MTNLNELTKAIKKYEAKTSLTKAEDKKYCDLLAEAKNRVAAFEAKDYLTKTENKEYTTLYNIVK